MKNILFILLIWCSSAFSQERIDVEINNNRRELEKLKTQIKDLKSKIYKAEKEAKSLLQQIDEIEKEIALISEIKRLLGKENRLLQEKINSTQQSLKKKNDQLDRLKEQYSKRVIHTYKYGKIKNIELLINSDSFNQALIRYKYLKIFAEQEIRLIKNIKAKIEEIKNLELKLQHQYNRQKITLQEKEQEQQNYVNLKNEKDALVSKIRWDERTLSQKLNRAENEYQKLYQIILALEKKRKIRESQAKPIESFDLPLKNFSKTKGKLPWPVQGQIVSKYGKQRNKLLKTYIKNTGIDIKVNPGTEVQVVFQGLVSMITYLAGYGNTVILDHGEGYYTVYSHLDEVLVDKDQYLGPGDTIGLAGSTGSLEGAKLHFEIYAKKTTVNPQTWLK